MSDLLILFSVGFGQTSQFSPAFFSPLVFLAAPTRNKQQKGYRNPEMAVGQNQWYHFGVGAAPILVYFSGDWDGHCEYGILTHGQMSNLKMMEVLQPTIMEFGEFQSSSYE